MEKTAQSATRDEPLSKFVESIGCRNGISGYIFDTVPCVVQTWLRHQKDFRTGLEDILAAGGDADTTAAILGGIIGAGVGRQGVPREWIAGIAEWPRTVKWIADLGEMLSLALYGDIKASQPSLAN